jgi:hypothetical protein
MKIILSEAEVHEALLNYVNEAFSTKFDTVSFGTYVSIQEATFEVSKLEATEETA